MRNTLFNIFEEKALKETAVLVKTPFAIQTGDLAHIAIVLKEQAGQRVCVMEIGAFEARAVALGLTNQPTPRPLTHDLMINLLNASDTSIDKVVITKLVSEIYYAVIYIRDKTGKIIQIDSRPSDAMALAVRKNCPIFINDELLKLNKSVDEIMEKLNQQSTAMLYTHPSMSDEEAMVFLHSLDLDKLPKA